MATNPETFNVDSWLRGQLESGPQHVIDVAAQARRDGIDRADLLKSALRLDVHEIGAASNRTWYLGKAK